MPLFRRGRPAAPVTVEQVAEIVKSAMGELMTQTGAQTRTLVDQARARSIPGPAGYNPLPRYPFEVPFDPGRPLTPAPFDQPLPDTDRSGPRRWQYPVSWNLQQGDQRQVPFSVLRQAGEIDLARRCIDLRISDIVGLDFDITLTDQAINTEMAETGETSRARAAAKIRDRYRDEIAATKAFWETPDRAADQSFSQWLTMLLEEMLVIDAACVWPQPTLGARSPVPGVKGDIHSFVIVAGDTIKPLLAADGGPPRPPFPAFQQILFGFPRGEFMLSDDLSLDDRSLFDSDRLVYRRRYPRVSTPYGFSPVEKALPMLDLWMKREEWQRSVYNYGADPGTWLETVQGTDPESWTPAQRRMWQDALNNDLSGNTAARQMLQVLPPGWKPLVGQQPEEKFKSELDDWMTKTVGAYFDVMPTQLGIVPRAGLGGKGHQEGEEDKMQAQARQPTVEWLTDLLNDLSWRFLRTSKALTFRFHERSEDTDLDHIEARGKAMDYGLTTLNDAQNDSGRPLYDFPNADRPYRMVDGVGLVWMDTGLPSPEPEPEPVDGGTDDGSVGDGEPVDSGSSGGSDGHRGAQGAGPAQQATPAQKAAEAASYRRWVTKHAAADRPFVWRYHDAVEADAVKAATRPKVRGQGPALADIAPSG